MVTDVLELLDVTPNFGWIDAGRRWTSGAKRWETKQNRQTV